MTKTRLPPGFRFNPTDEELVKYYLERKVLGKRLRPEVIGEIDIYKYAPWRLPDRSCLKTRDLKWYFFSPREKKYASGSRISRTADLGYWKTTGKDKTVRYNSADVGQKKTFIFYRGKSPKGERTNWVMHEYRLDEKDLADRGIDQHSYVLCVIFEKGGCGPKNGAQYGAPFKEEEWNDDEEDDEEVNGRELFSFVGGCNQSSATPNDPSSSLVAFPSVLENVALDPSASCPPETLPPVIGGSTLSFATPDDPNISHAAFPSVLENLPLKPSASCPLQTLPHVHHNVVCDTDANEENSQFLPEDEELTAMLATILETADSSNKMDGNQANSCPDTNDFYNELTDLGNLEGLDQNGSNAISNGHYAPFYVDQRFGHDNLLFVELMDLDVPLDRSSEFNRYRQVDRGVECPNNYNYDTGHFYHSSVASNNPGLVSEVIEIPNDRPDRFESQMPNEYIKEGDAGEGL